MSHTLTVKHYYEFDFWSPNWKRIHKFPGKEVGLNRYQPLLPAKITISLGEGSTPLLKASDSLTKYFGLANLWIKHEEMNPTGCFKDRESALAISAAKRSGVKIVSIASSGNAALSTAAYAKKARIKCVAYVPQETTREKKELIQLFGAELKIIPGNYEKVYRYLADLKTKNLNVTSGQNYLRTEANKTIAFEIWEQIGMPDAVVVPAGNGGCLAGIWKGFWDLKQVGKTTKIPRMIAVQVKNAAPLEKALRENSETAVVANVPDSIAEGIVAEESYCSPKAIKAIKESQGAVITVTDREILEALATITRYESFISEPTSAAAFAALPKLPLELQDKQIVCVNTGSGMKMISKIAEILKSSPMI